MACVDNDPPKKSSKMLCPCSKCKEQRGEQQTYQIAARAARNAGNFASAGGNCLGQLASMMPWGNCNNQNGSDGCDESSGSPKREKRKCNCKKSKNNRNNKSDEEDERVDCSSITEEDDCGSSSNNRSSNKRSSNKRSSDDNGESGGFDCDDDKAACLCAATPAAATSISCFVCESVATIGFFVIAIVVFWVSAGYHLGQLFWRFYKNQPKTFTLPQIQGLSKGNSGGDCNIDCDTAGLDCS